eukprot:COSAG01_NODE_348_length_18498_cov_181.563128_14_plen_85_part_00
MSSQPEDCWGRAPKRRHIRGIASSDGIGDNQQTASASLAQILASWGQLAPVDTLDSVLCACKQLGVGALEKQLRVLQETGSYYG